MKLFLSLLCLSMCGVANALKLSASTLDDHSNRIVIISPKNNQTLQNQRDISVNVAVYPKLKPGDKIVIYVDKKSSISADSTNIKILIPNRGEHEINAKLIRADGQNAESQTIKIFLHLNSILHNFSNLKHANSTN